MHFITRTIAAGLVSGLSYLLICSALRPRGWIGPSALSPHENYLAIGVAILVFGLVLWRLHNHTWGKDQVDSLLDVDDV